MKDDACVRFSLTVVIPTHHRPAGLQALLASILRDPSHELISEILVVSNLPDERVEKVCENAADSRIRALCARNIGANSARRTGLQNTKTEWVYFLDDDCTIRGPGHFQAVRDFLSRHPIVGGIGGPYLSPGSLGIWKKAYNVRLNSWLERWRSDADCWQLLGGNAVYRTGCLRDVDAFSSPRAFGIVEAELNSNLVNSGVLLKYSAEIGIDHWVEGNLFSMFRRAWLQGRNFRRMNDAGKYFPSRMPSQLRQRKISRGSGLVRVFIELYMVAFKAGNLCQKFSKH